MMMYTFQGKGATSNTGEDASHSRELLVEFIRFGFAKETQVE